MTTDTTIALAVSDDRGLDSLVDARFGRAPFFVFVTDEGPSVAVASNPGVDAEQGAGSSAVGFVLRHGVSTVVANELGPKALSALQAARVQSYRAPAGTSVRDAVELLLAGVLEPIGLKEYR